MASPKSPTARKRPRMFTMRTDGEAAVFWDDILDVQKMVTPDGERPPHVADIVRRLAAKERARLHKERNRPRGR
jgi:hypothetical protein